MKLEGIVSKRRDAPYRSGNQCGWVKIKCATWREANKERWRLFERHREPLGGVCGLYHFILELLNRADAEANHFVDSVDADSLGELRSCLAQLLWFCTGTAEALSNLAMLRDEMALL